MKAFENEFEFNETSLDCIAMKKKLIRCYLSTLVIDNTSTDVYYLTQEGWKKSLCICTNCAELFCINWENPKTLGLSINQIANNQTCPKCGLSLESTLKDYPETFITRNGEIGHFSPSNEIPPDSESIVVNLWEIQPD